MDRRSFLQTLGLGLLSAGCAASATSPAVAPGSATPAPAAGTAGPGPSPAGASTAGAPARPAEVLKVRIVQSAPGLVYAPIYIANARGYWAEEGLDVDWQLVQGGQIAMTALVNDEVQLMATASTDPVIGWERGLPLISVAGITTSLTLGIAARRDWMESKGVTRQSPFRDRVAALKGARIGSATAGGGPVQYLRFLLHRHGLDPDRDAEFLAVGQGTARVAALWQGLVDLVVGGAPDAEVAEAEGFAAVYVNMATDDPFFENLVFTVLSATTDYTERNSEAVRRAVWAIGRANNLIRTDFPAAATVLKEAMPDIGPGVIDLALANVQTAYARDAAMNEEMWRNAVEVLVATGTLTRQPPVAEGTIWTNRFVR